MINREERIWLILITTLTAILFVLMIVVNTTLNRMIDKLDSVDFGAVGKLSDQVNQLRVEIDNHQDVQLIDGFSWLVDEQNKRIVQNRNQEK